MSSLVILSLFVDLILTLLYLDVLPAYYVYLSIRSIDAAAVLSPYGALALISVLFICWRHL